MAVTWVGSASCYLGPASVGRITMPPSGTMRAAPASKVLGTGTAAALSGVDVLTVNMNMENLTQNASTTTATIESQDGSAVGQLQSVTINQQGVIDLPSGTLTLHATRGDLTLGAGSSTLAPGSFRCTLAPGLHDLPGWAVPGGDAAI